MLDRIVVPLDGSLASEQILPHLRRLLFRHDSEILLVRAAVPPISETGVVSLAMDDLIGAAKNYLQEMQDRLEQQGARVRSIVRAGSAVGVILDVTDEEKATMVAMA